MSQGSAIEGLDHVLLLTNSLDAAAKRMRDLGFSVSPRGYHSPQMGSANHTIIFEKNYIELWGVVVPTELNAVHRANLARGEGVHAIALRTRSVSELATQFESSNVEIEAQLDFSRPVSLPSGSAEAVFAVLRLARHELPNGYWFYCQHHTPGSVFVPEWMTHPNTASSIEAVVVCADNPAATSQVYSPLFGCKTNEALPGGIRLRGANAAIEFLTRQEIGRKYGAAGVERAGGPFFKVVRLGVHNLSAAVSCLERSGISFCVDSGRLCVPPDVAHGLLLEFVENR